MSGKIEHVEEKSTIKNELVFFAKVISGGRVTIPDEIRALLGIKVGDIVQVKVKKVKRDE